MDDVLINKATIIEHCLKRLDDLYPGHEHELETNLDRQDAILLNLQRACEAAIDAAMHLVRRNRLGVPQQSRDAFVMLEGAGIIEQELSERMQAMVGFRNVAVHNYQQLSIPIVQSILESSLTDFRDMVTVLLRLAEEK
ncbi:MAG: DUF86 domain-containing protein [Gammaproteobacteria bacterium]|nr:DUF86 domain-containing protein [Gammaproteobacteria bacterium]MCW8993440.1 DUF86 domain-containing protein [Gammaproteobacteria bacterium]